MRIDTSKIKRIHLVIFQPRISHEPEEWETSEEALENFASKAKLAVLHCEKAIKSHKGLQSYQQAQEWQKKFLTPGESQCRWCKAKSQCLAIADKCLQGILVPVASADDLEILSNSNCVTVPDDLGVKNAIANVAHLDFNTVAKVYANKKLFGTWLKAIESRMLTDMVNGAETADFKLVKGRGGDREWSDAEAVEAEMKEAEIKDTDMYEKKLISVACAEKLLKRSPDKWKKLQPFITRSEGALTVAPIKDKRPAVARIEEDLSGLEFLLDEQIDIDDLI